MRRWLLLSWLAGLVLVEGLRGEVASAPAAADTQPIDYFLVVTGGELLEGVYPDAHTSFIARTLRAIGCRCLGVLLVDDRREDIQEACRFATNKASLIVVTGGLGPTPNDITRETLAEFTGIPLAEQPDLLAALARRFGQSPDQLRPNLRRQTQTPVSGGYLKNSVGTAAGLVYERGSLLVVALPGPPKELQPMVTQELAPLLRRRFGAREFGDSLTLRFVGVGQSAIDQTIKDHVRLAPDVVVTSLFEGNRVDFTFSLPGHRPEGLERLKRLEAEIRQHLEPFLYTDDGATLEEVVLGLVRRRCASLRLAEIGTRGALAVALGGARGGDACLAGASVAPDEKALGPMLERNAATPPSGLTAAERAKAWVDCLARTAPAAGALYVGPLETRTGGGRSLWLGARFPERPPEAMEVSLPDSAELGPRNLVTAVLDTLRRAWR